jgi:hypothetical protein
VLLTEIVESTKFENTSQVSGHAVSAASSMACFSSPGSPPPPGSLPSQQVLS